MFGLLGLFFKVFGLLGLFFKVFGLLGLFLRFLGCYLLLVSRSGPALQQLWSTARRSGHDQRLRVAGWRCVDPSSPAPSSGGFLSQPGEVRCTYSTQKGDI